ncbi:hypothetical protein NA57DRAFT_50195 [Rhizodiscina lignyota]|uniref:Low temperature requirement protein A n=1 Tax=Rhizodiscina lignyota TaxID=1504668 RepID=A0A9P4M424_9PEZI|nr:hypothetical protein NA57DRAFT_50195 [Rhizodiscina lignyota]
MASEDSEAAALGHRYLIKRPKVLQYFYGGQLKKANDEERQAGRFELFLDLLYVALVANMAENFADHANGNGLVKYMLIFRHAWSDLREVMNSYYNDDLLQRCLILWVMGLLILYASSGEPIDESENDGIPGLSALRATTGAYMTARLTIILIYYIYSFASHQHRPQARIFASLNLVGLFLWIPMFFETISLRGKIAVAVVAIVYEEAAWIWSFGPWVKKMLKLEYSTAVDVEHEIDRQAAFYIIVLGEFVYGIVVGSPAGIGLTLNYFRAVEVLVIAFSFNWIYVNRDGSIESTHPLSRSVVSAFIWFIIHLPLTASLLIGGHVASVSVGKEGLESGERWLLCGGLAAGLFCLWIIGVLENGRDPPKILIMPKPVRMLPRLLCAITLAAVPLADSLNVTQLLSIPTGLILFIVVWETIGALKRCSNIFESWRDTISEENAAVEKSESKPAMLDGNRGELMSTLEQ